MNNIRITYEYPMCYRYKCAAKVVKILESTKFEWQIL